MCKVCLQVGENTATITNLFEIEVNGTLIHSKKVSETVVYIFNGVHKLYYFIQQDGDGFVDNEFKKNKIKAAVQVALRTASHNSEQ